MNAPQPELLFVYNADAGLLNGVLDTLHKTFAPATYPCSLCAVTYGARTMYPEWRVFLERLPARTQFLHRDELARQYPALRATSLPVVFRRDAAIEPWQVFLSALELRPLDLAGLMQAVETRLRETNQPASGL
ncbi:hypothetical protein [Hymenobacter swuensis]|uniref:GTPase n=1 Tax=Hymenobacter swuensis DY53 TaxID=1227739 RepID=W8F5W7_9BACT|nr:hypothetical protein [Hymenobacter swuensis]AHJ97981.1 hypothetical protein Hsw_2386 [Hymenobacter swuensis DY53]